MTSRSVSVDNGIIRALERVVAALEGAVEGRERFGRREVPKWLPNGAEASTVAQVAAMMNTTLPIAAHHILESKDVGAELVREAKDVVAGCGIPPKRQRLRMIERPKRKRITRRVARRKR